MINYHGVNLTGFVCSRVTVNGRDVKVNIFDMSGHALFYDVSDVEMK